MLETYFVKPQTVDRIRACWIGVGLASEERAVGADDHPHPRSITGPMMNVRAAGSRG